MTPAQLKNALELKFNVLCFVDLADINQSLSTVYKIFNDHRREVFDSADRLVFYSNHTPSNELIDHICQAADTIDIGRFFIMICCPTPLLTSENNIEYFKVKVTSQSLLADNITNSNSMCLLPWMHLAIMNRGDVKPCCVSNEIIGNVSDQPLTDIFNNTQMFTLRNALSTGKKPAGCSHCWDLESQNIESNRQWNLTHYKKQLYSEWIDNPSIRSIDFRPSNVCNFKCRICNPAASSLLAAEQLSLTKNIGKISILKNLDLKGKWYDEDEKFINQILNLLPNLENIDFYGGEPFLLKQLPIILKKAVDTDESSHIRLHFNTNGSIFPDKLIPYFQKFKQIDISVSIDNIKDRFEFERGGVWDEIESNIELFKKEPTVKFNISIMPTVNIQNVLYLDQLIAWADKNEHRIIFNYLDGPLYMNINHMTVAAKELVINKYQNHAHPELRNISNRVQGSTGSDGTKFINYMQKLDSHRKENFLNSHYEIAIAMGYSV